MVVRMSVAMSKAVAEEAEEAEVVVVAVAEAAAVAARQQVEMGHSVGRARLVYRTTHCAALSPVSRSE